MAALINCLFHLTLASSISVEDSPSREERIAAVKALIAEIAEPAWADERDAPECSEFELSCA
jgi:hypothetical protein